MVAGIGKVRPAAFHILLQLAGSEMHGLGIAQSVDEATDGAFTLGPGTLYRHLKELARNGLIEEIAPPTPDEDPRRRFYRITDRGRGVVQAEAEQLARLVDVARDKRVLPGAS